MGLILCFLLKKLEKNSNIFILSVLWGLLLTVSYSIFIKIFVKVFPRYSIYIDGTSAFSVLKGTGNGRILFLYLFLFLLLILRIRSKNNNNKYDEYHLKLIPILTFGLTVGIISCKNELINRLLWYYIMFFITLIPNTINKYSSKSRLLLSIGIFVALFLYSLLSLITKQNGIIPYLV